MSAGGGGSGLSAKVVQRAERAEKRENEAVKEVKRREERIAVLEKKVQEATAQAAVQKTISSKLQVSVYVSVCVCIHPILSTIPIQLLTLTMTGLLSITHNTYNTQERLVKEGHDAQHNLNLTAVVSDEA